jgi:hypothetical protein
METCYHTWALFEFEDSSITQYSKWTTSTLLISERMSMMLSVLRVPAVPARHHALLGDTKSYGTVL